ncbi:MAG: ABC transporter permease [Acidimicrobiales bacterium]
MAEPDRQTAPSTPVPDTAPARGTLAVASMAPRARLGIAGWLAIAWLVAVLGMALFAPLLPLPDPDRSAFPPGLPLFSDGHLFGTDSNGRDVLSRVVHGARVSLLIGFSAVTFGMVVGGALGLYAGYFRNRVVAAIGWLFDVLLSFPALVLALSLVAVLAGRPDTSDLKRNLVIILALGIVAVPLLGRITRGTTLTWSRREFVLAARALGAKDLRIMVREVLPNVLPAMFSLALLSVAVAIVAEGGLAVLGAGTQSISWGSMIANGRSDLQRVPNVVLVPSTFIFLTVLALNYIGDIVRARFDVRESIL